MLVRPRLRPRPRSVRRSVLPAALGSFVIAAAAACIGATGSAGASRPLGPTHRQAAAVQQQPVVKASGSSVVVGSRPVTVAQQAAGSSGDDVTTAPRDPVGRPTAGDAPSDMDAPIQGGLSARQEQALAIRLIAAHREVVTAPDPGHWTAAIGRTAATRARSWLGMPYSWAGGTGAGPSTGVCDPGTGGDLDCHVTGFDCSGLTLNAWAPYVSLAHFAQTQATAAGKFHPSLAQLLPGDLVFFAGYLPGGIGHVAIYVGHGTVIEAPQSGSVVHEAKLADLVVDDGYRGATRPLTGEPPVLATLTKPVSTQGGTLVLHGAHLASVDAVAIGGTVVGKFTAHTDTSLTLRAPAHRAQRLPLVATTPWSSSEPGSLTYATPTRTPALTHVPSSAPTTSAPTSTAPTTTAPTTTAPTTSAPITPAPRPTLPRPTPTPSATTQASTSPSKPTSSPTTRASSTEPATVQQPTPASTSP